MTDRIKPEEEKTRSRKLAGGGRGLNTKDCRSKES